jgi:hypothetical protein
MNDFIMLVVMIYYACCWFYYVCCDSINMGIKYRKLVNKYYSKMMISTKWFYKWTKFSDQIFGS